jgi:FecR protein
MIANVSQNARRLATLLAGHAINLRLRSNQGEEHPLSGHRSTISSVQQTRLTILHGRSDKELSISGRNILTCRLIWLAICSILSTASAVLAQDVVGSITEIKGIAQLQRRGRNLDAALTMGIQMHDKVLTMHDAHLTITLNGGNQLRLAASSAIVIELQTNDTHDRFVIDLLAGHLVSIVRSGTVPAMTVRTPNALAAVNGAEFETAYIEGKSCPDSPPCLSYTDVGVFEGIVQVSNPTNPQNPSVRVKPGLETAVPCDLPPTAPAPVGMRELGMPTYH